VVGQIETLYERKAAMKNKLSSFTAMIALAALTTTAVAAAATHSPRTSEPSSLSAAESTTAAFDVPPSTEQSINAHHYHGGPKAND
jgi:hypothetical protein